MQGFFWVSTRILYSSCCWSSMTTNAGISSTSVTQTLAPQNAVGDSEGQDSTPTCCCWSGTCYDTILWKALFLVSGDIMVLLRIALLFIILFPVLCAIVEVLVKHTNLLNIQTAREYADLLLCNKPPTFLFFCKIMENTNFVDREQGNRNLESDKLQSSSSGA